MLKRSSRDVCSWCCVNVVKNRAKQARKDEPNHG